MDRILNYPSAVPRVLDVLKTGQNGMVGLAKLSEAVLGSSTVLSGFVVSQTSPASLSVLVGVGQIYTQQQLETSAISSLTVDSHVIVKQGVLLDPSTVPLTPPITPGYAVNVLLEVQYLEVDDTPILLNYYNAANPSVPLTGPSGNVQQQNTRRAGSVAIQAKYGTPAASGSQGTPAPDAGWSGIGVVTVGYGQTSVTAGNISIYGAGPFLPTPLPGVPSGVQGGQWVYGVASGTNTYAVSLFATSAYPFALKTGMEILVYFANANTTTTPTLNANGSGAISIRLQGGGAPAPGDIAGYVPLVYGGTNWRVNGLVQSDVVTTVTLNFAVRVPLTANLNLYVAASGGDDMANTGLSAGSPFATLQRAYNFLQQTYDLRGFTATINVANGTYTAGVAVSQTVLGAIGPQSIIFKGNSSSPGSCIISTSGVVSPIGATNGGVCTLDGFTIVSSGASGIGAGYGGIVWFQNLNFGSISGSQIVANSGGQIVAIGNYYISGGATFSHIAVIAGGQVNIGGATVTISGTPAFPSGFVNSATLGLILAQSTTFAGTGTTGVRYSANSGSVIYTSGSAPAAYFPGNASGVVATGGQYY